MESSRAVGERAIITGGAGFIGSHLVDRLLSEGIEVTIVDNFSTGRRENLTQLGRSHIELLALECDLRFPDDNLQEATASASTIFHFAANPEVRLSTTEPRTHFDNNVIATFNLLELWRRFHSEARFVFASSSSVYGQPDKLPVKESDPCNPASVYGATKLSCEELIATYCRLYGLSAVALRYANILGPRLTHGVVIDFVRKLQRDPSHLEVLGDGTQRRSYLYIDDAIEATLLALQGGENDFRVFNVGNLDSLTVEEIAQTTIKALSFSHPRIDYCRDYGPLGWPGDVHQIVLEVQKLTRLGFRPGRTSRDAVKLTAEYASRERL